MKLLYVFIALSVFTSQSKAQSNFWIDSGAVWHYDYGLFAEGGFHKLKYTKDTLIQGNNCQELIDSTYTFYAQITGTILFGYATATPYYTYTNGDTIFWLKNGEFLTLFNFAAQVGDTWTIDKSSTSILSCDTISQVEVTQKDSIQINGNWYRTLSLQSIPGSFSEIRGGLVVERFGTMGYGFLFPLGLSCDSNIIVDYQQFSFTCFEDKSFPLYNPSGNECEYLLTHQSIEENSDLAFDLFPNPANAVLNLNFNKTIPEKIEIINLEGKVIQQISTGLEKQVQLDVSYLESGIYFIKCIKNNNSSTIRKWMKF